MKPTRFEDEFPEAGEVLADICTERGKDKEDGHKLDPIYLDSPQPVEMVYELRNGHRDHPTYSSVTTFKRTEPKVGRNDPCPCESGKKFKKCCME